MFSARSDSVTNIHKRWSFTRISPFSYKISLAISLLTAAIIITLSYIYDAQKSQNNLAVYLTSALGAIVALNFLDFIALYGTPINKISKTFHVSAFGNLLWSATLLTGIVLDFLFSKYPNSAGYFLEGMLLVVSFRIAIFTSVFGSGIPRAIVVSFIQPIIFSMILLTPFEFYSNLVENRIILAFGSFFIVLAIIWSVLADRAGRPFVKSTFNLLQAFLAAWTEQKAEKMEAITESKAKKNAIVTHILKFRSRNSNDEFSVILPGIHPGPFGPIGGSDLPYVLYKFFSRKAIVLHGASDHSLNIPSKQELQKYLRSLATTSCTVEKNLYTCTVPIQMKIDGCTTTGIGFGSIGIIILSMAPRGMEDVPKDISIELEVYASKLGLSQILVIDSHNGMGSSLGKKEQQNLLRCARECLEKIKNSEQYPFSAAYASSEYDQYSDYFQKNNNNNNKTKLNEDLGQAGLAMLVIEVTNTKYALGWADSNNMENGVRDAILSYVNACGVNMIEICTSDTHSTSGKRTRHGYYPLGSITDRNEIAKTFVKLAEKSAERIKESCFELLSIESNIKLMGKNQFDDYSKALDRSMNMTKVFLALSVLMSIYMLFLT
jgi:putative membrane protein